MVNEQSYCEKHRLICTLFAIILLCACAFLFYAGWWLPIEIDNHRLRHNQLIPFEIYNVKVTDWYKYSIFSERMSVLTYRQQQSYDYNFILGSFESSNFSLDGLELLIDENANTLTTNDTMTGLIPITWDSFVQYVDNNIAPQNDQNLRLTMYSAAKCIDPKTSSTEIYDCFHDWFEANNGTDAPEYYIYTELNNNVAVNVNSIHASKVLDGPRDVFMLIIMFFCCIWFLLVIDYFEDSTIGWDAFNYLFITLFFIGAYYLWVFVLSVVPVFFSMPMFHDADKSDPLYHYKEAVLSLTFVVGNYNPLWWVAGVLINGFWAYALVCFIPVVGAIYVLIAACCCCDDEKTDQWGGCVVIPILLVSICIIIIFTFGYYAVFIGNMVYWNTKTYKDISDINVIQTVSALCVYYFLLPILGYLVFATTRWNKKYDEKNKKVKVINRVGTSMQAIPLVRNRVSAKKDKSYAKVKTNVNNGDTKKDDGHDTDVDVEITMCTAEKVTVLKTDDLSSSDSN